MSGSSTGVLYVVATPIGHLDDLTPRAAQTLAKVGLIAAEDTRHSGRLLTHIGCKTRLLALHDHNEAKVVDGIIAHLLSGESVALVSDAGTPLVSDPGYRLVRAAHEHAIAVSPVPGASAVTAALSVAGIATDRFCFEGFLPAKQSARRDRLTALSAETRTLVFYESVHRIADSLDDMASVFGEERRAFVGRELTKMHEECIHATLAGLVMKIRDESLLRKGEFVVIVAGAEPSTETPSEIDPLLLRLSEKLPTKEVAGIIADVYGLRKNDIYERLLALRR